mmetsp:Transcript_136801/g.354882  ORF Transcript_136801/g.354882 Transcript_136801/m.354882 type:complete len:98 (-) Transcript_136801:2807-3100(-)
MSVGVAGNGCEAPVRPELCIDEWGLELALGATTGTSASSGAGEVGDGSSVGTGISVGEDGACPELKATDPIAEEKCAVPEGPLGTFTNSSASSAARR